MSSTGTVYVDFGARIYGYLLEMEGVYTGNIFNRFGLRQFQMFNGIACRHVEPVKTILGAILFHLFIG